MAPETKSKKRKSGGAVASPSTKKLKKVDAPAPEEQPAPVKSSKKSKKDAPKQEEEAPAPKSKSSRKRASDFFDAAEAEEKAAEKPTPKKSKKAKKEKDEEPAAKPASAAKAVNGKKRKAAEEPAPAEDRIPHGFYEHQMKAYFSQFGEISRLRLARNKKTGRSKHYAFIEFANNDVAKIVAETMDKYLMFGHILQVRHVPAEQVHPELFKGSNKRFKPAPRNKMQGRHLRLGMDREGWDKRIEREERRRKNKEDKLKEMGYEFKAPAIKSTSKVPKKSQAPAETEEAPKTLTEKPHNEEDQEVVEAMETAKKSKKSKKRESTGAVEEKKEKEPVKVKATKEKKASKPKAKKAKTSA
ncbi:hypothetical protein BFW01_g8326 [Lasiodiplodia theobromae]|nr:hypothetical protein BFW01_g8326 [Lasiodiplodia theobromae]